RKRGRAEFKACAGGRFGFGRGRRCAAEARDGVLRLRFPIGTAKFFRGGGIPANRLAALLRGFEKLAELKGDHGVASLLEKSAQLRERVLAGARAANASGDLFPIGHSPYVNALIVFRAGLLRLAPGLRWERIVATEPTQGQLRSDDLPRRALTPGGSPCCWRSPARQNRTNLCAMPRRSFRMLVRARARPTRTAV